MEMISTPWRKTLSMPTITRHSAEICLRYLFDAGHPVQDERWSPGQDAIAYDRVGALGKAFAIPDSDIEISDLTPQAVEVETEYQTQAK
eukprot:8289668-Pyramimonas_sp.AAC.1